MSPSLEALEHTSSKRWKGKARQLYPVEETTYVQSSSSVTRRLPRKYSVRRRSPVLLDPQAIPAKWNGKVRAVSPEDIQGSGGRDGIVLPLEMIGSGMYDVAYVVEIKVGRTDSPQTFQLQVDSGSSDLWISSNSCSTSSCALTNGRLYNPSTSGATATNATFTIDYLQGGVSGPIYWDRVNVGGYFIENQALSAASTVSNQLLAPNFNGILGLALPLNSVIASTIAPVTTNDPDGAAWASNLFSITPVVNAPGARFISMVLGRPGSSRVPSLLGIGKHPNGLVPDPTKIEYSTLVSESIGTLFWKTTVRSIVVYVDGTPSPIELPRGGSGSVFPSAILDSGVPLIFTTSTIANAIYGAIGVGPAEDGQYYVPCTTPLNITIRLDNRSEMPMHPLDLTADPPGVNRAHFCVGLIQALDEELGRPAGSAVDADMILGVPFLRSVYSVMAYVPPESDGSFVPTVDPEEEVHEPEHEQEEEPAEVEEDPLDPSSSQSSLRPTGSRNATSSHSSASASTPITTRTMAYTRPMPSAPPTNLIIPRLGLLSITDPTLALEEFRTVRILNKPIDSANESSSNPNGGGGGSSARAGAEGGRMLSTGIIVLIAIVGFFALCGLIFVVRWVVTRRRYGSGSEVAGDAGTSADPAGGGGGSEDPLGVWGNEGGVRSRGRGRGEEGNASEDRLHIMGGGEANSEVLFMSPLGTGKYDDGDDRSTASGRPSTLRSRDTHADTLHNGRRSSVEAGFAEVGVGTGRVRSRSTGERQEGADASPFAEPPALPRGVQQRRSSVSINALGREQEEGEDAWDPTTGLPWGGARRSGSYSSRRTTAIRHVEDDRTSRRERVDSGTLPVNWPGTPPAPRRRRSRGGSSVGGPGSPRDLEGSWDERERLYDPNPSPFRSPMPRASRHAHSASSPLLSSLSPGVSSFLHEEGPGSPPASRRERGSYLASPTPVGRGRNPLPDSELASPFLPASDSHPLSPSSNETSKIPPAPSIGDASDLVPMSSLPSPSATTKRLISLSASIPPPPLSSISISRQPPPPPPPRSWQRQRKRSIPSPVMQLVDEFGVFDSSRLVKPIYPTAHTSPTTTIFPTNNDLSATKNTSSKDPGSVVSVVNVGSVTGRLSFETLRREDVEGRRVVKRSGESRRSVFEGDSRGVVVSAS